MESEVSVKPSAMSIWAVMLVAERSVLDNIVEKVLTRNLAWASLRQKGMPRGYPGMGLQGLEMEAAVATAAVARRENNFILNERTRCDISVRSGQVGRPRMLWTSGQTGLGGGRYIYWCTKSLRIRTIC